MDRKDEFLKNANFYRDTMIRYIQCMSDLKYRYWFIKRLIDLDEIDFDQIEHLCLNFRMITELIMLSSFAAHADDYFLNLSEKATMWNIKDLTAVIEKANPNYWPRPVKITPSKFAEFSADISFKESELSKADLDKIHSMCSWYLHSQNPFAKDKTYSVAEDFHVWLEKIKALLTAHTISLIGSGKFATVQIDFESEPYTLNDISMSYQEHK